MFPLPLCSRLGWFEGCFQSELLWNMFWREQSSGPTLSYLCLLHVSLTSLENVASWRNEETKSSIGLIGEQNVTASVDSNSKNPVSVPQLVFFTSHSSTGHAEAYRHVFSLVNSHQATFRKTWLMIWFVLIFKPHPHFLFVSYCNEMH